ncbi:ABC transporter ATP-binding protein [Amycolatopsis rubida]|uniref:ABC-type multidrug transport system, ATPase and permease component n=1 Tax=Amycolatopsis rubida TaxID=112413 RepID=A0A1I5S3M1_9PSEU|nr:ABC transporter ATP-binding protein [Amycolatopsis rubida]SFP65352.1 ABC-type multidrug transport system, ATPase and permease component [Amycolatopsis rubida]
MPEAPLLSEKPRLRGVLRRTVPFLRPHRGVLAMAIGLGTAATLALTLVPSVVGWAVDRVAGRDGEGLGFAAAAFAGLVLARLILLRSGEIWLAKAGERVVKSLRDLVVSRLATAPLRFLEAQRSGDLLRRSTTEIADLASFVRGDLPDLLSVTGYLLFTTILLLVYSWQLTLVVVLVFLPLSVLVMRWFQRGAGPAFAAEAAAQAAVAATYREGLQAREAIVSRGAEDQWRERFDRDAAEVRKTALRTEFVVLRTGGVTLAQSVADATILVFGGGLVLAWGLPLSTVAVFVVAMRQLFDSTNQLTTLIGQLQTSRTGLARLLDLLDLAERPAGSGRGADVPERGVLEASTVDFQYTAGVPVLTGVSCTFPPGSRTGLVGPTGSGKTTLAKILTGLYPVDGGCVRYAGVPLEEIEPDLLRRRIMLVPQRVHLVAGTLRDNIRLVPDPPPDERIARALEELGLREWAANLPAGLDTPAGDSLSAGERQLVGLIRAALVDPAVLVLDEATADVDPATGDRIERALDRLHAGRSLIVVAHRQSTIDRLPAAVRLESGRVLAGER